MTASASASACRISSTKTVISVELFGQLALAGTLSPFRFQGRQVFERYLAAIEAWPSIPALSAADASLFIYSNDLPLGARGHRLGQDIFQKLGRFASWYRGLLREAPLSAMTPAQGENGESREFVHSRCRIPKWHSQRQDWASRCSKRNVRPREGRSCYSRPPFGSVT